MSWDIFISHASEDKETFVRPLATFLTKNKIKIWYDEFTIRLGESLREKIDEGIIKSNYGLIVISPNFIRKEWTKKELNGFFSKEIIEKTNSILPIWLNVDSKDVFNYSPILFDKFAFKNDSNNIENIGEKIIDFIKDNTFSISIAKENIEHFYNLSKFDIDNKFNEISFRLTKLLNYFNEINAIKIPKKFNNDEYSEIEYKKFYAPIIEKIENKYDFPNGLWIHEEFDLEESKRVKMHLRKWLDGKMNFEECNEYYFDLDFLANIDISYIFFDIPNFSHINSIINIKEHFYKIGTRNII